MGTNDRVRCRCVAIKHQHACLSPDRVARCKRGVNAGAVCARCHPRVCMERCRPRPHPNLIIPTSRCPCTRSRSLERGPKWYKNIAFPVRMCRCCNVIHSGGWYGRRQGGPLGSPTLTSHVNGNANAVDISGSPAGVLQPGCRTETGSSSGRWVSTAAAPGAGPHCSGDLQPRWSG